MIILFPFISYDILIEERKKRANGHGWVGGGGSVGHDGEEGRKREGMHKSEWK